MLFSVSHGALNYSASHNTPAFAFSLATPSARAWVSDVPVPPLGALLSYRRWPTQALYAPLLEDFARVTLTGNDLFESMNWVTSLSR